MLKLFKVEGILISCQYFYRTSAGRKDILKVIPTISFLCVIIIIVGVDFPIFIELECSLGLSDFNFRKRFFSAFHCSK